MYPIFAVSEQHRQNLTREAEQERLAREILAGQKVSDGTYWMPQQVLDKLLNLMSAGVERVRGASQVTMQPEIGANSVCVECGAAA